MITRGEIDRLDRLEKKLKKYKQSYLIVVCCFFILAFLFAFFLGEIYLFKNTSFSNKNILFENNFTLEERSYWTDIINDVNPEYVEMTRDITFTKDELYDKKGNKLYGYNQFRNVYIRIYPDCNSRCIKRTKIVICHELLHSIVVSNNEEYFVTDISQSDFCFKKDKKR